MSTLKVSSLQHPSSASANITLNSDGTIALPAGGVLQVVSTTKTDTFSYASSGFQDVTGLSVTITPSSASSKVLIMYQIAVGASTSGDVDVRVTRGGTVVGDQSLDANPYTASQPGGVSGGLTIGAFNYLDSPATTSALTYQVQTNRRFAGTQYVNRNGSNNRFSVSSITAMEIAG